MVLERYQCLLELLLGISKCRSSSRRGDPGRDQSVMKWWNDEFPSPEERDLYELHQVLFGDARIPDRFERSHDGTTRGSRGQAIDNLVDA